MSTSPHVKPTYFDHHAEIVIDRQDKRNALSTEMLRALQATLAEIAQRAEVRAVILTGAGDRAFIAGADIAEMAALDAEGIADFALLGHSVADALADLPQPVIAAVNGFALGGGCELLLACDVAIAAESALIGLPEIDLALIPGWGGTQRLPRRVGTNKALELILTGARLSAAEALRVGLVDRVAPDANVLAEARELAATLAGKSPQALRVAKQAVRQAISIPLAEGLRRERQAFANLFATPEREAATARFVKK